MATTVESPGITSAKEEAAAILFGRETTQAQPTAKTVVKAEPAAPKFPNFASYRDPEPMPARPKAVDTSAFRPYQNFDEVMVTAEPQVVCPYIDNSDYVPAAAVTTVTTPATTTKEAAQTVTVVQSALDTELEEDTQYIVKFKNSTIVAATIVATIFLLLAILFVVNIVNLATISAEVNTMIQESTTLEQTLAEGQAALDEARQAAAANGGGAARNPQYVAKADSTYTAPSNTSGSSSFFDWLCHALSRLFN